MSGTNPGSDKAQSGTADRSQSVDARRSGWNTAALHRLAVVLQCTWGLPQTLLGFVVLVVVRVRDRLACTGRYRTGTYLTRTPLISGGVSLGLFLFATDYRRRGMPRRVQQQLDDHEWGHAVQSLMLGPLYLIVVGLPSITRALWFRFRGPADSGRYFKAYPENWADRLGGVQRRRSS